MRILRLRKRLIKSIELKAPNWGFFSFAFSLFKSGTCTTQSATLLFFALKHDAGHANFLYPLRKQIFMYSKVFIKAGLLGVLATNPILCYAKAVDSSNSFSLNASEIGGGTKASVVANVSVSNSTSLDTDTQAPPYIIGEEHVGGTWHNIGLASNCLDWTPLTNTVNFGVVFTQEQECDVTRERTITVYDVWSNGKRTVKHTYTDQQSDGVVNERQATGTKHYITGQSVTYSSWSNSGSPYSCSTWTPNESTVDAGKKFTQTSSCEQKQTQLKKTFNNWTDARTDLVKTETLEQVINTSKSRSATGTKKPAIVEECRDFKQGGSYVGIINGIQINQSGSWLYWDGQISTQRHYYNDWTRVGSYEYKKGSSYGGGGSQSSWGVCRRNTP